MVITFVVMVTVVAMVTVIVILYIFMVNSNVRYSVSNGNMCLNRLCGTRRYDTRWMHGY